ncbi:MULTISPECIES: bifunctional allantoicase/(S)-ureidoglycine aminohydrolase [unclassified Bradyrhizobium]|uniref:bifunctional allantoicase/(S)-ureidoglycine aminohydrolase n=1 Tax=unclassified Bradyrhizobium TaxID=2631580 RepID=UPI001FF59DA1|nr:MULTISPECIES: bifunctional allantoicase/(S)-ureidoglycine aminohydrolase [unclassified Bradyrhizobium]MCJ9699602.1 (S)-ureidoglycine aminohydrolase [Bradyrhizobium sp. SHOUNA76]MCJ9729854.1 (S)-ureidoglycine aminohydrolase [Bradyrhizobium sp. PRIMUS42]
MSSQTYHIPQGGLPPQTDLLSGRAVFTNAYAVIPNGVQRDIVVSHLPHWDNTRVWVLARPLSGFAETFSHYLMEIAPAGGSDVPEPEKDAEGGLFVVGGKLSLKLADGEHELRPGSFAYVPPGCAWSIRNRGEGPAQVHWIRKLYQRVPGLAAPEAIVTNEGAIAPVAMPGTEGRWATTRFIDPADMRHDMHLNIVTFEPGATIPFAETHVMEHGLYVLEGKAVYRLNRDWVEVEAGDYMWLRAFCPQACYAGGPGRFRYLLYKDVNRHMNLRQGPPLI